jgi:hypothetical protein
VEYGGISMGQNSLKLDWIVRRRRGGFSRQKNRGNVCLID